MKIQNITDVEKFFEVVDQCKGTVELVSPEGLSLIHICIINHDVDVLTGCQHVVYTAEADIVSPSVTTEYLDTFGIGALNGSASDKLVAALDGIDCPTCKDIVKNKDFLAKKSQWVFGGDGWAYDIGFGGVDPVSYTHLMM